MTKKTQTKTEEKPKGKKKVGMVEIPQTSLNAIMGKIKELEESRDMLLQIADKKQLGNYYQRHKGKIPTRVMLRTIDDKVILGWRTIQDEVYKDPETMRWYEKQRIEVLYEDGKGQEFHLSDYVRKYKQVEAEVRSKITDEETGSVALKVVRRDNGKEYTIGIAYVN